MKTPNTIEELKRFYADLGLPDEKITRFFIGKNILEKRAFGIYQEVDGSFIVYKNKDDGTRVIRYQGSDEAYAVKELWNRLVKEIYNQISKGHGGFLNYSNIALLIDVPDSKADKKNIQPLEECDTYSCERCGARLTADDPFCHICGSRRIEKHSAESRKLYASVDHSNDNKVMLWITISVILFFVLSYLKSMSGFSNKDYDSSDYSDSYYDSYDYDSGWDSGDTDFSSDW